MKHKELLDCSKQNLTDRDLPRIWAQVAAEQREFVDLSYNKGTIQHLHLKAEQLQSLRFLYAYKSNIQSITIDGDLPNLQILSLAKNQLTDFRLPRGFAALEHLRLDENQLKEVELESVEGLQSLESLFLQGNEVQNIPQEILEREENCKERVWTFLKDKKESGAVQNNEVKVILVGNGSVGKTQIAMRLEQQKDYVFNKQHESTHAIALLKREMACSYLPDGLTLNIWDFGGQDIYHATHRMFMQHNALFLLVWDAENETKPSHNYNGRDYKNETLDYWLRYVDCFGKGSPVLVLQNKIDRLFEKKMPPPTQKSFQREHANIVRFLEVSAKKGKGFLILEKEIQKVFAEHSVLKESLLRELPASWVAVRNRVRTEQKNPQGRKEIDQSTFGNWCEAAGVADSAQYILEFLHDTGVLFYQERYFSGSIILDQAWAIEAVYKVLNKDSDYFEILEDKKGVLEYEDLCEIWERESDAERSLFIDFMLNCELCFETTTEKPEYGNPELKDRTFVVPQLMATERPDYLEDAEYMRHYELEEQKRLPFHFLPPVFMYRFLVQASDFAEVGDMWRQGVLMEYEGAFALVEADYADKCIVLHYSKQATQLVLAIEQQLDIIAQEGKVQPQKESSEMTEKMVGMGYLKRGLEGLKDSAAAPKSSMVELFVSYSIEDISFKEKFSTHLTTLKKRGFIRSWDEGDILAGQNRTDKSQAALQKADMIVLLVSSDYLESKWETELAEVMQRARNREVKVVPILVRPCDWEGAPFEHLELIPRSKVAVSLAPNRDEAWLEVVRELKVLLR
ncbi:MAG: COR domain-containing protein [Chitinophagales bacterium]